MKIICKDKNYCLEFVGLLGRARRVVSNIECWAATAIDVVVMEEAVVFQLFNERLGRSVTKR